MERGQDRLNNRFTQEETNPVLKTFIQSTDYFFIFWMQMLLESQPLMLKKKFY